MSVLQAVYFDGKDSRRHAVSVMIAGGKLKVTWDAGSNMTRLEDATGAQTKVTKEIYSKASARVATGPRLRSSTSSRRHPVSTRSWPIASAMAFILRVTGIYTLQDTSFNSRKKQPADSKFLLACIYGKETGDISMPSDQRLSQSGCRMRMRSSRNVATISGALDCSFPNATCLSSRLG